MSFKTAVSIIISIFFLSCLSPAFSASQESVPDTSASERRLSVEELKEDFRLLRTSLEEAHAGLYYYSTKKVMDTRFDQTLKELDHPMPEPEFYKHLALLIAAVNDGHTRLRFSAEYDNYLSRRPILLPFNLCFLREKTYIFRNYSSDPDFPLGSEVVSINGTPMADIIARLLPLIPSDGRIQTSKLRYLEGTENFGRIYTLIFGETGEFEIGYQPADSGSLSKIKVDGITAEVLNERFRERYPEAARTKPPIELAYRGDTAILTIRTFSESGYRSAGMAYPTFLKETFREFSEKAVENLIIDLRENGGGTDMFGKLLVSYLLDKTYMYYNFLEVARNAFSFLEHTNEPNLDTNLKNRLRPNDKGTYDLRFHPNLGEQKPLSPTFTGRVFIMISGRSFSGTGECTSILHHHKRAVFVGEECGAGYYGNTSGVMPLLTLPNSGLRIRIPMVRYHMAVSGYEPRDRGIIPEFPFVPDIADLVAGRDPELEFTLDLISKRYPKECP